MGAECLVTEFDYDPRVPVFFSWSKKTDNLKAAGDDMPEKNYATCKRKGCHLERLLDEFRTLGKINRLELHQTTSRENNLKPTK